MSTISAKFNPDILCGDTDDNQKQLFIRGNEYFTNKNGIDDEAKREKSSKEEGEASYVSEVDSDDEFDNLKKLRG